MERNVLYTLAGRVPELIITNGGPLFIGISASPPPSDLELRYLRERAEHKADELLFAQMSRN